MKASYLAVEHLPKGFNLDFNPSLFNLACHRRLQSKEGWQLYYLLSKKVKKPVIKNAPQIDVMAQHNLTATLFLNRKFHLTKAEINACIAVDEVDFKDKIDLWKKENYDSLLKQN